MDNTASKPQLSTEEIALLQEIVDDEFIVTNVSVRAIETAIADYACHKWQA